MSYKVMVQAYSLSVDAKWDVSSRKLALSIFLLSSYFYMHYKMHFFTFYVKLYIHIFMFFSCQLEIKYYYYYRLSNLSNSVWYSNSRLDTFSIFSAINAELDMARSDPMLK